MRMMKFGHRIQTALFYGFAMMLLSFMLLNVAVTGVNIMAETEVFHPIGLPLFAGAIVFFVSLGLASSETMDAKAAEAKAKTT